MRDPLGPPPGARHPDTVFLLGLCLLSGLLQLFNTTRSGVTALLPYWLTAAWAALLVIGATTTLVGVFWRRRVTGMLLELAGRVCFAPAALIFAAGVIAVAGPPGLLAAVPFIGFAASSIWRIVQIHRHIGEVRDVLAIMRWARDHRDEP